MMKRLMFIAALALAALATAAHAATNLAVVCTTASEVGKPVPTSCPIVAPTTQVYRTPADTDLVRVDSTKLPGQKADFNNYNPATYVWKAFVDVPVGGVYEVCTGDVVEDHSVATDVPLPGCASWAFIAKAPTATTTTGLVHLTWTPPTGNTDGTPLTDLKGFYVYQGASPTTLVKLATNLGPGATSFDLSLPVGTFYFAMTAFSTGGEGPKSGVASISVLKPVTLPGAPLQFKATVTFPSP